MYGIPDSVKPVSYTHLGCGNGALCSLKDEVVAADDHPFAAYAACHAVGHNVLHLGVHLLMGNAALFGGTHHGVCLLYTSRCV